MRKYLYLVSQDLYCRSCNDGLLYYIRGIDRVSYYLVKYYASHNYMYEKLTIPSNFESISMNIGICVRTVGRSIRKLRERGMISITGKHITMSYEQYKRMQQALSETIALNDMSHPD